MEKKGLAGWGRFNGQWWAQAPGGPVLKAETWAELEQELIRLYSESFIQGA